MKNWLHVSDFELYILHVFIFSAASLNSVTATVSSIMQIGKKKTCRYCLFLQLHSLSYRQNVYIVPFSITFSSSICYTNSFFAFKHRSLLFWLCSNMTEHTIREICSGGFFFFPVSPHHDGSITGEQHRVWKYHQGRWVYICCLSDEI